MGVGGGVGLEVGVGWGGAEGGGGVWVGLGLGVGRVGWGGAGGAGGTPGEPHAGQPAPIRRRLAGVSGPDRHEASTRGEPQLDAKPLRARHTWMHWQHLTACSRPHLTACCRPTTGRRQHVHSFTGHPSTRSIVHVDSRAA